MEYRFYAPIKEGRTGLISIKDCVELAIRGFEVHIHRSDERIRGNKMDGLEPTSILKKKNEGGFRIGMTKFYMGSIRGRLKSE